jgi:hypothetical protein
MYFNKRGQFYLIISIILAVAVFGVTAKSNTIQPAVLFEDFEDLSDNYIQESEHVINYALERDDQDVEVYLDDFTKDYIKYARQRNPDLKILYVYSDGSEATLVNYLDEPVTTDAIGTEVITGSGEPLAQDVQINIGGKAFSYKVPVRAENFGYGWYSGSVPTDPFQLTVAGFVHNFDISSTGPELKVIVNLPEGQAEISEGTEGYEFLSPPIDEELVRQVKVRE